MKLLYISTSFDQVCNNNDMRTFLTNPCTIDWVRPPLFLMNYCSIHIIPVISIDIDWQSFKVDDLLKSEWQGTNKIKKKCCVKKLTHISSVSEWMAVKEIPQVPEKFLTSLAIWFALQSQNFN